MASFKQRCGVCKKNWALVHSGRVRFAVCVECEMKEARKPVEDKEFAAMFALPKDWYQENSFLRSVRYQYGVFGHLTPKQIEAFKKTVVGLKEGKKRIEVKA